MLLVVITRENHLKYKNSQGQQADRALKKFSSLVTYFGKRIVDDFQWVCWEKVHQEVRNSTCAI